MSDVARQTIAAGVENLSAAALKQIAASLHIHLPAKSRTSAVQAVGRFLGTPQHREALRALLEPADWQALNLLLWRLEPIRERDLRDALRAWGRTATTAPASPSQPGDQIPIPLATRRSEDPAREWVARLFAHGCLLPAGAYRWPIEIRAESFDGYEPTFVERTPGLEVWANEMAPLAPPFAPAPAPAESVPDAFTELQRTLFIVVAEVTAKPARLKQSGGMYEADITRLASAVARAAGARTKEEPAVFWFALSLLIEAGLLVSDENRLAAAPAAAAFFEHGHEEQIPPLIDAWAASLYDDLSRVSTLVTRRDNAGRPWFHADGFTPISRVDLAAARAFTLVALIELVERDPFSWYRISDLAAFAYQQHPAFLFSTQSTAWYMNAAWGTNAKGYYYGVTRVTPDAANETRLNRDTDWPEVEGAFVRQVVIEAWRWLGLVEVGPTLDAPECFRLTAVARHVLCGVPYTPVGDEAAAPAHPRALTVQPNFDVIVPNAMNGVGLLAQLDAFAERRSLDVAATYHLSRTAFTAALDKGWTLARVVEVLEGSSERPLPQNVRFSLDEWAAVHSRLTLSTGATIIAANNERQLDGWLKDAELPALLGGRLGPRHVLVPTEKVQAARKRIAALGVLLKVIDEAAPIGKVVRLKEPDLVRISGGVQPTSYLLYRLRAMADADGNPADLVFRLSAASIARANAMGWNGRELLEFLGSITKDAAVPVATRTRVLGWSGMLPAACFEPLMAVQLPDKALNWNELQQLPGVAGLLRAVPSAALALVAPADMEALAKALEPHGILLKDGVVAFTAPPTETAEEELRRVLRAHRDTPEIVLAAIRNARLLGKLDRERGYY